MKNSLNFLGAFCWVIWGLLHIQAAYLVYHLAQPLTADMIQGRLYQDAFCLLTFAVSAIFIALFANVKGSRYAFWLNFMMISLSDMGFVVLILLPGYAPIWPGVLGPIFWIAGSFFAFMGMEKK